MKNSTREKFKHLSRIEVRFADVDAFGHVNNAKYLTYFEQARVHYFDELTGWKYDWSRHGVILAKADIDFILPVKFRDVIEVGTRCTKIGTKSFELQYEMYRTAGEEISLMSKCTSVMVAFDYSTGSSIVVPQEWTSAMEIYDGVKKS